VLALAFALLNCFRGRGWVPGDRIIACLGMGVCAGLYAGQWHIGITVALGTYLWALPAWGKHFVAITGATARERLRGLLGMSLRGLYLYPLFVALAWLTTPWALPIGLGCLLQGPCYFAMRHTPDWQEWAVARAELLFGAVIGGMVSLCLAPPL
jgi:hypothetical protein